MFEPVIKVENLSKRFGDILAVDDISFEVAAGATTALLGSNGAGKTTTLAMLLGLLLPTSGRVLALGVDMSRRRRHALPRMNFSSPYVDLPHRLSVYQNLSVYAHIYGLRDVRGRIGALADELDLVPLLKRKTGTLSAGQRTRLALAKALLNQPELLLLDEPTASLDPDTADWVRGYLQRYQARTGATIMLASHNMLEVERLCSSVLMMRAGRIVDQGTPDELIARYGGETLEQAFLQIARGTDTRTAAQ